MEFALWEQVLLLLLTAAILVVATRELRPKIAFVLAGSPDRVRTDQLGARLARLVREV